MFAALLSLAAAYAVAEHVYIYRWVDPVDGDVHYAEHPPAQADYDLVATEGPPPPDAEAERRHRDIEAQAEQGLIEQRRRRAEARRRATDAAVRRNECERLREWLSRLESRPGSRLLVIESENSARRMTESERQERLAETRERIGEVCEGGASAGSMQEQSGATPT
ncbi:MAG: DUF4124 domain-containing protein [Pseudomonadales bacterium]